METKVQPAPPAAVGVLAGHGAEAPAAGHVRITVQKFAELNEQGDFTLVGVVEALGAGVGTPPVGSRVLGIGKYDGFDHAFLSAEMVRVLPESKPGENDVAFVHASSPPPRLPALLVGAACLGLGAACFLRAWAVAGAELAGAFLFAQVSASAALVQRVRVRRSWVLMLAGGLLLCGLSGAGAAAARTLTGSWGWTGLWLAAWWLPGAVCVVSVTRGGRIHMAWAPGWTFALTALGWGWVAQPGGEAGGAGHVALLAVGTLVGSVGTAVLVESAWLGRGQQRPWWPAWGPAGRDWALPILALPLLLVAAGWAAPHVPVLRSVDALTPPAAYFSHGWTPWAGAGAARPPGGKRSQESVQSDADQAPVEPAGPAAQAGRPRWWSCYERVFREVYAFEKEFGSACSRALKRCKVNGAEGLAAGAEPCKGTGWWPAPEN